VAGRAKFIQMRSSTPSPQRSPRHGRRTRRQRPQPRVRRTDVDRPIMAYDGRPDWDARDLQQDRANRGHPGARTEHGGPERPHFTMSTSPLAEERLHVMERQSTTTCYGGRIQGYSATATADGNRARRRPGLDDGGAHGRQTRGLGDGCNAAVPGTPGQSRSASAASRSSPGAMAADDISSSSSPPSQRRPTGLAYEQSGPRRPRTFDQLHEAKLENAQSGSILEIATLASTPRPKDPHGRWVRGRY